MNLYDISRLYDTTAAKQFLDVAWLMANYWLHSIWRLTML